MLSRPDTRSSLFSVRLPSCLPLEPLQVLRLTAPEHVHLLFAGVAERKSLTRAGALKSRERYETLVRGIEVQTLDLDLRLRAAHALFAGSDVEDQDLRLRIVGARQTEVQLAAPMPDHDGIGRVVAIEIGIQRRTDVPTDRRVRRAEARIRAR